MIHLRPRNYYKIKFGAIKIYVEKIKYKCDEYTKAKIVIYTLKGDYLETIRNAKLYHNKINHWELA